MDIHEIICDFYHEDEFENNILPHIPEMISVCQKLISEIEVPSKKSFYFKTPINTWDEYLSFKGIIGKVFAIHHIIHTLKWRIIQMMKKVYLLPQYDNGYDNNVFIVDVICETPTGQILVINLKQFSRTHSFDDSKVNKQIEGYRHCFHKIPPWVTFVQLVTIWPEEEQQIIKGEIYSVYGYQQLEQCLETMVEHKVYIIPNNIIGGYILDKWDIPQGNKYILDNISYANLKVFSKNNNLDFSRVEQMIAFGNLMILNRDEMVTDKQELCLDFNYNVFGRNVKTVNDIEDNRFAYCLGVVHSMRIIDRHLDIKRKMFKKGEFFYEPLLI